MSNIEGPLTTENKSETSSDDPEVNKTKSRKSRKAASKLINKEISSDKEPLKDKPKDWLGQDIDIKPKPLSEVNSKLKDDEPVSEDRAPDDSLSSEERQVVVAALKEQADEHLSDEFATKTDWGVQEAIDELYDLVAESDITPIEAEAIVLASRDMSIEPTLEPSATENDEAEINQPAAETFDQEDFKPQISEATNLDNPGPAEINRLELNNHGSGNQPPEQPPTTGGNAEPPGFGGPRRAIFAENTEFIPPRNQTQPETNAAIDNVEDNSNVIAGLIIGYLYGRRRGRKKAEKRLLPKQRKLEKQVKDLEQDLIASEYRIKKIVSKNNNVLRASRFNKSSDSEPDSSVRQRPVAELSLDFVADTIMPLRTKAPEAKILHRVEPAGERIGRLVIATEIVESRSPSKPKQEILKPDKLAEFKAVSVKQVETMNRAELMRISEKMYVEGSSLRQIYETHLVGEKGLRRLVTEFLKGGDVKKVLRREIVEREIDFERDPVMRDQARASGGGTSTSSNSNLQNMIQKAEAAVATPTEEAAFYKAKADYEVEERQRDHKRRKQADTAITSLIVVLAVIITLLLLSRN
jgi:hypothetical protein